MQIGFALPQLGSQASPENLIKIAVRAEELGYDSLWVLERLLWPLNPRVPYPAAPDGKLPEVFQSVFDPIETLTFVAARTERIGLGTSVIVSSYHNPVILSKRLATLDQLSGGRLLCGLGVGWSPDEFEASGVPFGKRGTRTDEFLKLLVHLWTSEVVEFKGEFYTVPASKIGPKPLPRPALPHPPIYLAGFTPMTLERIAQWAQGWNPVPLMSLDELRTSIQTLRELTAKYGRDPKQIEAILRIFPRLTAEPLGSQRDFCSGSVGELADDVKRLGELGVTGLIIDLNFFPQFAHLSAMLEALEQLASLLQS
jgi:probable F420-dependent oxidoreductase